MCHHPSTFVGKNYTLKSPNRAIQQVFNYICRL